MKLKQRVQLLDVIGYIIDTEEVCYLEFGVFTGKSLRYMSSVLQSPKCELHGFDSFQGLPEDWNEGGVPRGFFSLNGIAPKFNDPRIKIHVGLFENTLPKFIIPTDKRLIVNVDSDLYSSARCILAHVSPHLKRNDMIYFDEWHVTECEKKAAHDFGLDSRIKHIISWTQGALFEVLT